MRILYISVNSILSQNNILMAISNVITATLRSQANMSFLFASLGICRTLFCILMVGMAILWRYRVSFSYNLFRPPKASIEYYHRENHSNGYYSDPHDQTINPHNL